MDFHPLHRLRETFAAQEKWHQPWTSGSVNLSGSALTLFFKCKDGSSRHIELGSAKEADTEALIDACLPATFGRGSENVLDEGYRKAWMLDAGGFSWMFNPDSARFVAELAQGLCPWDSLDRGIRIEPYKLNVYGKGGFFKSHKDTPQAEDMFGTLVFILPIRHQGGNLLLRHGESELNFESSLLLKEAPSAATAAYVAFYSDVEHEVLEVTSGYRVTITFNLFFDLTRHSLAVPFSRSKIPENPFTAILRENLRNPNFVRMHKYLGFGLEYTYPQRADEYGPNLTRCLKGPDSFLYLVLSKLGLKPELRYLYRSEYGSCDFWVMREGIIDGRQQNEASNETELDYLLEDTEASIVWANRKSEEVLGSSPVSYRHPWICSYYNDAQRYRTRTLPVDWVTNPSDNLVGRTAWVEVGNEPAHEVYYYAVCIIVHVAASPAAEGVNT